MCRQGIFVAALTLLTAVTGLAQAEPPLPTVSVALPPDVSSEKVWAQYVLYGSFGAHGDAVVRRAGAHVLRISAAVEGTPAGLAKIFVWSPGCRIATFDIRLQKSSDVHKSFVCSLLPTVSLVGQIRVSELPSTEQLEVRVDYLASWACDFFGLADCMVPQIPLGAANPDEQGVFQIDLPDFSADPISSDPNNNGAELQLVIQGVRTGNLIGFLEPEPEALRAPGHALKISASYPQNLAFLMRKID